MSRTRRFDKRRFDYDEPQATYMPRKKKKQRTAPPSIREIDYRAYCQSPHYLELKARLFAERGGCEICQSTRSLSLHHLRYIYRGQSVLWNERDEDVMVMCWPCHHAWETHCRGVRLTDEVRDRLKALYALGVGRDVVFPAAVATNFDELMAGYKAANDRRSRGIDRPSGMFVY